MKKQERKAKRAREIEGTQHSKNNIITWNNREGRRSHSRFRRA